MIAGGSNLDASEMASEPDRWLQGMKPLAETFERNAAFYQRCTSRPSERRSLIRLVSANGFSRAGCGDGRAGVWL